MLRSLLVVLAFSLSAGSLWAQSAAPTLVADTEVVVTAPELKAIEETDRDIFIVIDGNQIEKLQDIHDLFVQALKLPSYYGRNFDALEDVLTDKQFTPKKINITIVSGFVLGQKIGKKALQTLCDVINAAQENNRDSMGFPVIDFLYW